MYILRKEDFSATGSDIVDAGKVGVWEEERVPAHTSVTPVRGRLYPIRAAVGKSADHHRVMITGASPEILLKGRRDCSGMIRT